MKYLVFHKPLDVLCQFTRSGPDARVSTLADYIDVTDVYAVGRLDAESEGLLFLTDDGRMQHAVSSPRFKQPKTYVVQVEGEPTAAHARRLERGVPIGGRLARARSVRVLEHAPVLAPRARPIRYRTSIPTGWMEIVLTEGRNRQVRRMTAAVGLPTLRLVRTAIGPLRLEGLLPGEWRWLSPAEVEALRRSCQLDDTREASRTLPPGGKNRRNPEGVHHVRDRRRKIYRQDGK